MSQVPGLSKVLIANRGEIAVRVARTLARLGIASAVVAHAEDAKSPAARAVDEICPLEGPTPVAAHLAGPPPIPAAKPTGADSIHPRHGFLS